MVDLNKMLDEGDLKGAFGVLDNIFALNNLWTVIMDQFEKANPTVEVKHVTIGNNVSDDVVPAFGDFWLKVTTNDDKWLHVYLNKETWKIEWY